jgi:hypothetical protein
MPFPMTKAGARRWRTTAARFDVAASHPAIVHGRPVAGLIATPVVYPGRTGDVPSTSSWQPS